MESKIDEFGVLVKFVDPDNLPGSFTTEDYLQGYIVSIIPSPNGNNWVLKLKHTIRCFDAVGDYHNANTFLLQPMGLDDVEIMKKSPLDTTKIKGLEALAMLLKDGNWPNEITTYEDYKKYTVINAVSIRADESNCVHLKILR